MYTRNAVLAPPTYVGFGRFQHGPNVVADFRDKDGHG
jgi:hypothetical protein